MIENRPHQCNFVYGGYEWEGVGLRDSYWVVPYRCQMRPSLIQYIVSGRILRNREARARGVPMMEYTKRERRRKSGQESGGNECVGNKRR